MIECAFQFLLELVRDGIIWFAGKLKKKGHNFSHFWHERFFTLTQDAFVNRKENVSMKRIHCRLVHMKYCSSLI